MTLIEKAKAYDEALKKAQCWLSDPQALEDFDFTIEDAIQNIFPELRESEDERIRKWLIKTLKGLCNSPVEIDGSYEMMLPAIAWLEKQKERKEWSEEDERMSSRCIKSIETSKSFADSDTFKSAKDKEISWLNNLVEDCKRRKDDIAKLCSNEWSDEDERKLNHILEIVHIASGSEASVDEKEGLEDFLKSLRPQAK